LRLRLRVDAKQADVPAAPGAETADVDAWIDADDLIRRVRLREAPGTKDEGLVTLEFFDFGQNVSIEAPPADQISDQPDEAG
jgi:hypothetical protein